MARGAEARPEPRPRIIVAVAAESGDDFIWSRVKQLPELLTAGPVKIKLAYFAEEGSRPARPYVSTRWARDADDLADLISHARSQCVCGCYLAVADILAEALQETRQSPVQALIVLGDIFRRHDLAASIKIAKDLNAAGTRLFVFQQGRSPDAEQAFRALASSTGGAYYQFNPHVERIAQRLPKLFEAVACYALGGTTARQARGDESAMVLLDQMNPTNQIAK
jgi:hypothetical protein